MARSRSLLHPAALLLLLLLLAAPLAALLYLTQCLKRPVRAASAGRVLEGEFQVLLHSRKRLDPRAPDDLSLR